MKKMIFAMAVTALIAGCSSSSNNNGNGGGGGTVTEQSLTNALEGSWMSDCQSDGRTFSREFLIVTKNGTGTTTKLGFADQSCSGNAQQLEATKNFTYKVELAKKVPGGTAVTITVEGQNPTTYGVVVNGSNMTATSPAGSLKYQKTKPGPGDGGNNDNGGNNGGGQNPAGDASAAFDAVAKGQWVSECKNVQNQSYQVITVINGGGSGTATSIIYQQPNCQGQPQVGENKSFSYRVDRFANGGGQVTVDEVPADITINGNVMTINSESGTLKYNKAR